jgi:hypothetical protein
VKQVFAIFAALFLLIRPFCDVQATGMAHDAGRGDVDSHGGTPCCADLEDGAVAKLAEPATVRIAGDGKLLFASAAAVLAWHPRFTSDAARRPLSPVLTRTSFYARSARVRR